MFGAEDPLSGIKLGRGSLCEDLIIDSSKAVLKPKNASFEVAAGLALVGVTAVLAMGKSGLEAGDSVFVNGGRGGAGLIMIQMAKEIVGANGKVVAICSGTNAGLVKSAGAGMARTWISHWHTNGLNLR